MTRRLLAALAALVTAAVLAISGLFRPTKVVRPVMAAAPTPVVKMAESFQAEAQQQSQAADAAQRKARRLERLKRRALHRLHKARHDVRKLRRVLRPQTIAERYLGTPYVWGGEAPSGFDCSGLMQFIFAHIGIHLPRTAAEQMQVGHSVSPSAVRPGDLIFYEGGGHVALYIGGGRVIHAPHTGDVVRIAEATMMPISAIRRVLPI